jgi:hypothetical protein
MEGHPRGLEYFCSLHVSEALMMTPVVAHVAVANMRKKFDADARSSARRDAGSWWKKLGARIFRNAV